MQGSLHARTSLTLMVKALISEIKHTIKVGGFLLGFGCVISKEMIAPPLLRLKQDLLPQRHFK